MEGAQKDKMAKTSINTLTTQAFNMKHEKH